MKYQGFSPNREQTGSAFKPMSEPLVPCGDCHARFQRFLTKRESTDLRRSREWVKPSRAQSGIYCCTENWPY
jgi:hypothetical protein